MFSVDSDIVLPEDALIKMLNYDKDMVSGVYIQRIPGTHTIELYRARDSVSREHIPYEDIRGKGLIEVDGCGFGCLLIKRKVLETVPMPHFVYKEALDHRFTYSEDVYFCVQAANCGFSIWADTDIQCDHVGSFSFTVG